jgi:hypothetical protein
MTQRSDPGHPVDLTQLNSEQLQALANDIPQFLQSHHGLTHPEILSFEFILESLIAYVDSVDVAVQSSVRFSATRSTIEVTEKSPILSDIPPISDLIDITREIEIHPKSQLLNSQNLEKLASLILVPPRTGKKGAGGGVNRGGKVAVRYQRSTRNGTPTDPQ